MTADNGEKKAAGQGQAKKSAVKYSKIIVALVIALNAGFAAAVLLVYLKTGTSPDKLIDRWFDWTSGELLLLFGVKATDLVALIARKSGKTKESDEGDG